MGTLKLDSENGLDRKDGFRLGDILHLGDDFFQFLCYDDNSPIAVRIGGQRYVGGGIYKLPSNSGITLNGAEEKIVGQPCMPEIILHSLVSPGNLPPMPAQRYSTPRSQRKQRLEALQLPLYGFEDFMLANLRLERVYWPLADHTAV